MRPTTGARRVRDSRRATALAVTLVVLTQVPVVAVFVPRIPVPIRTWEGLAVAWIVAATVWTLYALVHLLAPLADVLDHPDRDEWGPFATVNAYTHRSTDQLGLRLVHGIVGFCTTAFGVFVFVPVRPLSVLPAGVLLIAILLLCGHVGVTEPAGVRDPERHD